MTPTLALLFASATATVVLDGPILAVIAAAGLVSVAANVYLIVHVRRVEHRLARVLGEVDALRDVLDLRRERSGPHPPAPGPTPPPGGLINAP